MIFNLAGIIACASRYMTLRTGDLIAAGTLEGAGIGRKPQHFLISGGEVCLSIEGPGEQKQVYIA